MLRATVYYRFLVWRSQDENPFVYPDSLSGGRQDKNIENAQDIFQEFSSVIRKTFGALRVGLVADDLTAQSLSLECQVFQLTPLNYRYVLHCWKPDLILVESAWEGCRGAWRYGIATYPDHPRRTNRTLRKLVARARELAIPAAFWNKEDGVHFDRFIDSAALFDHVFTVDGNCVPRYRERLPAQCGVQPLMFAVQPRIHSFTGFDFRLRRAAFVGSYSRHIHAARRARQDMLFEAAAELGVTVYDRNSRRRSPDYRLPPLQHLDVRPRIAYRDTADVYRRYVASLNVNTIEDSDTMFSRRLVEILACGGMAVTTPARSVSRLFAPYCHVVDSAEAAREVCARLAHGPASDDLERARAGADYVLSEHTWAHRLAQIAEEVGL